MDRLVTVCQVLAIFYYLLLISHSRVCRASQTSNGTEIDKLIQEIFDIPSGSDAPTSDRGGSQLPPLPQYPVTQPDHEVRPEPNHQYPPVQPQTQTPPVHPQPQYPITPTTGPKPVEAHSNSDNEPNPCLVGECVPYYLCLNGSIITSGEGILDGMQIEIPHKKTTTEK